MDTDVIAAMARWPNVPAVYGWLSLTESGQWRLHPDGNAVLQPSAQGEPISSPQILAFIDRNYDVDAHGRWYFQNGPQRVYVRLDAAPYIAHLTTDTGSGELKLRTHTGLDIRGISAWYLDADGRLFASTDRGPALISGRDLALLLDRLVPAPAAGATGAGGAADAADAARAAQTQREDTAELLAACMQSGEPVTLRAHGLGISSDAVSLHPCTTNAVEQALGFVRLPAGD